MMVMSVCVRFNLANASFRANDLHYSTMHRTDPLAVNEQDCQLSRLPSHSTVKQFQTLRQNLMGFFEFPRLLTDYENSCQSPV